MSTQCAYVNRITGIRCENDSSYGCRTCWQHGARAPETIRKGKDHPHFKHGQRTIESQLKESRQSLQLRYLEDAGRLIGMIVGNKTPGRKPKGYAKLTLSEILERLT